MADAVNISQRAKSANKAPLFEPYSKVIIHVGLSSDGETEVTYTAGDDTGRTLEVSNEWGTQEMADNILERIQGYQYQPFQAEAALVDPSVELGDGITVNGIYSGIFVQATKFGPLMQSDVSAPVDEEIEHEYGFESSTDRAYTRMVAQTRSGITQNANEITLQVTELRYDTLDTSNSESLASRIIVNANSITQEVSDRQTAVSAEAQARADADDAEATARDTAISAAVTEMTSTIEQTASEIYASVVAKTGGETTSFAWDLQSDHFSLYSNSTEVFRASSSGITVKGNGEFSGKITATSGTIGGITIASNAIYTNGKTGIDTAVNGLHISASGISLGNGNFKVDNYGNVTMKSGSININDKFKVTSAGAITATSGTIGGFTIGSSAIYTNSQSAYSGTGTGIYFGSSGLRLGSNFSVDTSGNLKANNGTFGGNVYAKNIKYADGTSGSSTYGTLSGSAITTGTISGTVNGVQGQLKALSVSGSDIAQYAISGGTNGNIATNTLTDLNVYPNTYTGGGLSTQSLASGITNSLGYADLFNLSTTTNSTLDYFKAGQLVGTSSVYSPHFYKADQSGGTNEYDLVDHYHTFTEKDGKIIIGVPHNDSTISKRSFSIADTQTYKDGVSAVTIASGAVLSTNATSLRDFTSGFDFDLTSNLYTPSADKTIAYGRIKISNEDDDILKKIRVKVPASAEDVKVTLTDSGVNWNSNYKMYYYGAKASATDGLTSDEQSFSQYFNPTEAIEFGKSQASGYTNVTYSITDSQTSSKIIITVVVRGYDSSGNLVQLASGSHEYSK